MITPENLTQHELIGLKMKVAASKNKALIGLEGKVVGETQNMITLETEKGAVSVQKDICTLEFQVGAQRVQVSGTALKARPEERIKKR